jgi:hypothetical protein
VRSEQALCVCSFRGEEAKDAGTRAAGEQLDSSADGRVLKACTVDMSELL